MCRGSLLYRSCRDFAFAGGFFSGDFLPTNIEEKQSIQLQIPCKNSVAPRVRFHKQSVLPKPPSYVQESSRCGSCPKCALDGPPLRPHRTTPCDFCEAPGEGSRAGVGEGYWGMGVWRALGEASRSGTQLGPDPPLGVLELSGTNIASQNRSDHGGRKRARNQSAAEIAGFFKIASSNRNRLPLAILGAI